MKKLKKPAKSLIFTLAGAFMLLLQIFGVKINVPHVNKILEAVCALLILLGIITAPKSESDTDGDSDDLPDNKEE